jgi:drug/metabolite transporter (DMT)-like permease
MISKKQCLVELHSSLVIMSVTTLFPKLINLPVHYIVFGRSVIAAVAIYLYLKIRKKKCFLPSSSRYSAIFLTGILLAVHWLAFFKSIQISSVSIGIISFFTYPAMTIFLEPFFFKNRLHLSDFILAVLVICGVFLILPGFKFGHLTTQGVMWGLVAAFFFALRNIISKGILRTHSGEEVMMFQLIIIAFFLLPTIILFTANTIIASSNIVKIIVLGLFFTAIPHTLLIRSLSGLKPKTVSLLSSLQPLYCIIIAMLLLGEIPSFKIIIGGLLILSVVLFEALKCQEK